MSVVERPRKKSSNGSPGHFAPLHGEQGLRVKKAQATVEALPLQTCTECGRGFRADLPGLCGICSGGDRSPTAAAERLLPIITCKGCGQIYGADLVECPVCGDPPGGAAARPDPKRKETKVAGRETKRANRETKAGSGETPAKPPKPKETGPTRSTDVFARLAEIEICEQIREDFDAAEIETLAKSIAELGLLQPPIVRRVKGGPTLFRLVAGERRIRALKLLGQDSCKARDVGEITDAQAIEIQGDENLKRKDLNDVERAKWYVRMTTPAADGGAGLTQEQLAQREGVTQAEISNRMRLLRCPQWALDLVISQQMTRRHALELLPYAGNERIAEEIEQDTAKRIKDRGGLGTAADYADQVQDVVMRKGAKLARVVTIRDPYKYAELRIDKNHPQYADLEVVTLKRKWGGEQAIALNAPLANKILGEKAAAWKAKHEKAAKPAKGDKAKPLTAAQAKKQAEEQLAKRREQLENLVFDWRCWLCAEAIATDFVSARDAAIAAGLNATNLFEDSCDVGLLAMKQVWPKLGDVGLVWSKANTEQRERVLLAFARALFWHDEGNECAVGPWGRDRAEPELLAWCERLSVDLADAWRAKSESGQAFMGPLTDRYFELLDRDGLIELCIEWNVSAGMTDSADTIRSKLRNYSSRIFPLPAELAEIAGVKKKKGK